MTEVADPVRFFINTLLVICKIVKNNCFPFSPELMTLDNYFMVHNNSRCTFLVLQSNRHIALTYKSNSNYMYTIIFVREEKFAYCILTIN